MIRSGAWGCAGLDGGRHHDLHAQDLPEGLDTARHQRVLRAELVVAVGGQVVAELHELRQRHLVLGPDHVLGIGALEPDHAVGIDDDLVDQGIGQERPQIAELVLGMGVRDHQKTRSRLTKMVSGSPWRTLIVGAILR